MMVGMESSENKRVTVGQDITELKSLSAVAEATRDRLRHLLATARQSEALIRRLLSWDGKSVKRDELK